MNQQIGELIVLSCVSGFFGDALLQIIAPKIGGKTGWGLTPYFGQHGSGEALCIASGMMTVFYIIYFLILRLPPNPIYLALYGIILDLLFRELRLFPSLDGYYESLNYFWSGVWGAIPMVIPLFLYKLIKSEKTM